MSILLLQLIYLPLQNFYVYGEICFYCYILRIKHITNSNTLIFLEFNTKQIQLNYCYFLNLILLFLIHIFTKLYIISYKTANVSVIRLRALNGISDSQISPLAHGVHTLKTGGCHLHIFVFS